MTRENKLALVVGFGLILFVGILISDHFSTVRSQRAADFTRAALGTDSSIAGQADPQLIDLRPPVQQSQPAVSPATIELQPENPPASAPSMAQPPEEVRMVEQSEIPGFVPSVVDSEPASLTLHVVKPGESLFAICRRYYGDSNQVDALAQFNGIDEPSELRAGQPLRIPPGEDLGNGAMSSRPNPAASTATIVPIKVVKQGSAKPVAARTPAVTYTVRAGDSLRQIAQRVYGSKSKWKKLHDLNRNVIDDPDNLKVGTVLRLS